MKRLSALIFLFLIFLTQKIFSQQTSEVKLFQAAQKSGMTVYFDPLTESCILEKNGHQISFRQGDDFFLQDYKTLVQEKTPYLKDNVLYTSLNFMNQAENFFQKENSANPYRIGAILIDPGHGGKDPGASATHKVNGKTVKVVEKDVNLKVGLKLYDYLKKAYPDKNILMTRSTDVYLTLPQRTEIANSVKLGQNEAIIYVSIHVNASLDKTAAGYEVWYLSPGYRRQVLNDSSEEDKSVRQILNSMLEEEYTTESMLIANYILEGIGAQVGNESNSRGIKAEEWYVVRNANMPSVLVETGFLTNQKEGFLLADDRYLQKLAFGIYNGLQGFVTHFERSRGFTEAK
ncbi:MAG: N-acetylmuramoyl-L-alanine amidase [Treponema sp.]|nr:N-acetylmuramoyl-L-alanine amidase [Treponema sp.]